ncbi:MAG TPA: acetyltransferase [Sphingobium sp.]|uniref:acyltransferase n=1 Tax=Sphingobium sp. TaxID=1912891 RepID=UPI000ED27CD4|nr:acyltransferase [Sphingobium sp.]HAF40349.1 acetyltransferase [Sphingobium sp.]
MGKNPSVDLLKGALILFVMIGHAMEITHQQHPILWIGAGFRMPLMIGISGYLLNLAALRAASTRQLFARYGRRMLIPWGVAMLVYVMAGGWPVGWTAPIDLLLLPPFHLWYVPVLFFLVMLARLIPSPPILLLAIGTPVSLFIMASFGLNHGAIGTAPLALDSRFLSYPVYFFFGMVIAEREMPKRYLAVALLVAGLGMSWWSGLASGASPVTLMAARLLMCLGLIALLPAISALQLRLAPLNAIGRESLFFYLWHPMAMALLMAGGTGTAGLLTLAVPGLFLASRAIMRLPELGRMLGATPLQSAPPPSTAPVVQTV